MEFLSNDVFITWNNKQNLNEINLNLRWFLSDLRTTDVGASQQYASQVSASEHFEGTNEWIITYKHIPVYMNAIYFYLFL